MQDKGFTVQEIDQNYVAVSNDPEIKQRYGKVSPGSILLGILFLVVMVVRMARYQNNGNIFLLIGVFTALILAILFFTKRK
ncbi:MAG TPA: LPXTG cell wall anchor domain-containing protein [Chitinophagaceae bacterium]|jgi:LPXTG-motif cell wall-anchored protein|nr:LPXTG cell wall anchor domain-containing protein [Chitinophagaceae bacterium]